MTNLKVTYRMVTPLQTRGAENVEMRLPSIKAMLRFWYRAIKPDFNQPIEKERAQTHEEALFGSGRPKMGQGEIRLQWANHRQINRLQKSNRFANFRPNQEFTLSLSSHGANSHPDWQGLLASLWLLGKVGSLGYKSRRGYGSLALTHWRSTHPDIDPYLQALPFRHKPTIEAWIESFQQGLAVLQDWFAEARQVQTVHQHAHLGPNAAFYIGRQPFTHWSQALNQGRAVLKEFSRFKNAKPALGLARDDAKEWTYEEKCINRLASPICLRVVQTGSTFVPLFVFFSASYPLQHTRSKKNWPSLYNSAKKEFMRCLEQQHPFQRIDVEVVT